MSLAAADDQYEAQNDITSGDAPAGDSVDNDYASRTGQSHIPVLKDEKEIEDPIDPATADSDATLSKYLCIPIWLAAVAILDFYAMWSRLTLQ